MEGSPFGVTLHFVDEGIDSGDIIAQSRIQYNWSDNGESLYIQSLHEMFELFKKTYPQLRIFNFTSQKQIEAKGDLHFSREMGVASHIDLDRKYTARELLNLLRAKTFTGHPSCWFEDDGEEYEVRVDIKRKRV